MICGKTIDAITKTNVIIYKTNKKNLSMKKYRFIRLLGEGVNGHVCLIEDQENFKVYAMKRYAKDDEFSERELNILKLLLPKPSIYLIQMIDTIQTPLFLYILLEPMDSTLHAYMMAKKIQTAQIEATFVQLMKALKHCHELNIYHRDVKPANILINAHGDVKLCDFSLSKEVINPGNLTDYVVTLWYRAPELFFGCTWYNASIDVWAACCVLLEMIYGRPPFWPKENTEICQLKAIFAKIGKPTQDQLSKFTNSKLNINIDGFEDHVDRFWSNISFVDRTFVYDMQSRPSCNDILNELSTTISDIDQKVPFDIHQVDRVKLNSIPPADWNDVFVNTF